MTTASPHLWPRIFVGLILTGIVYYLLLLLHIHQNFEAVVPRFVPDDALYYLKIAQNISDGHGSVFSASVPTNGYHPLWMGILVALDWTFHPSARGFLELALLAAALITIAAAFALKRFLSESGFTPPLQCMGVALFLFLPWTSHLSLSCLETPVFFLCLFLFYACFERLRCTGDRSIRSMLFLGITSGLLMLSRTDSILMTAPLYLWLLLKSVTIHNIVRLTFAGLVASTLLAPWLLWNWVRFGALMQCSGEAMAYIGHFSAGPMDSFSYYVTCTGRIVTALYRLFCYIFQPHLRFEKEYFSTPLLLLLLLTFVVYVAVFMSVLLRKKRLLVPPSLLLPTVLMVIAYFYVRAFVQVWHISILLSLLILSLLNLMRHLNIRPVTCIAMTTALLMLTTWTRQFGYFYPQTGCFGGLEKLNQEPTRFKIGSTDSGYLGYFTSHHVVNLDGVVNNQALKYIKSGRLQDYIDQQGFSHVWTDQERMVFYNRNMNHKGVTPLPPPEGSAHP